MSLDSNNCMDLSDFSNNFYLILLLYFLSFNYQNNLQFFMIIFLLDKKRFCFRFSLKSSRYLLTDTQRKLYIYYIDIYFHKFLQKNITFLYFLLYCYIVKFHFSFSFNASMEQSNNDDQFMKLYIIIFPDTYGP